MKKNQSGAKAKVSRFMNENKAYQKYSIGEMTYGFPRVYDYNDNTNLKVGKYSSFADNIQIFLGGEHHSDYVSTYPFTTFLENDLDISDKKSKGSVNIGNDVWVANNVIILSGVTIGNGAIIGAGSVVTKDVKDYEIVAGNPSKHIRYRFSDEHINALKKIAWWNWTKQKISENYQLIMSNNIELFIKNHTK
ncbi:CatB-related O-acetyltransferase [Winogradskyella sp. PE311]|uniref:CatB-related O-acetyltransferase n=1 Tax=Winogradskyella sp. PE311 TaxID=3366943 RepID=UPI00397FB339